MVERNGRVEQRQGDPSEHLVAVTIDIEDWYHGPSVTGAPYGAFEDVSAFFAKWNDRYDYLSEPTRDILDLLSQFDIRATFFVVADVLENYPGLVESIVSKGHEIACHGLHHACKIDPTTKQPLLTPHEFMERTRHAKQALESVSGRTVLGYRAPSAFVAGWMLDCLEDLGFQYDSSLCANSLFNKTDSQLKGVGTAPYYPARNSLEPGPSREILEMPMPHLRAILKFPASGGPFLRFFGARYILMALRQARRRGDTLFYFHPIDICNEPFPGGFTKKRPLYWAAKGARTRRQIGKILTQRDLRFCTCQEMLDRAHARLEEGSP